MYSGSILRQKSTSNITDALKHMIEIVCIIDFLGKLRSDDLFDLFLSIYIKKKTETCASCTHAGPRT